MIPVFDGHNDTILRLAASASPAETWASSADGHLDLARAGTGGFAGGFFAIWVRPETEPEDPSFGRTFVATEDGYEAPLAPPETFVWAEAFALGQWERFAELAGDPRNEFVIARDAGQLHGPGIRAVLHLEGAEPIRPDLSNLDEWHARGIRSIGIVWSRPNAFGTGVPFKYPADPDIGPGLTPAGRGLVQACLDRRILVDCAHLNARGFDDVAEIGGQPMVVTHACAHAIAPTARNLTDRQIDIIGQTGGVMGINFHTGDLRADGQRTAETPMSLIVDHIAYVADRIGTEHVAFGSDFDGAMMPGELGDVAGLPRLLDHLADRGFDDEAITNIAAGNWYRLLGKVWTR